MIFTSLFCFPSSNKQKPHFASSLPQGGCYHEESLAHCLRVPAPFVRLFLVRILVGLSLALLIFLAMRESSHALLHHQGEKADMKHAMNRTITGAIAVFSRESAV